MLLSRQAAKHSPSIIFIDEIDGLAPKRTTNDSETSSCNNQIVTALLTLMDGITKYRDVLVIGEKKHFIITIILVVSISLLLNFAVEFNKSR